MILAVPVRFCAEILQVPFALPETFTIFVLLDFHDFTESPFAMPVTLKLRMDCFTFNGTVFAETFIVALSLFPTSRVSVVLQTEQVLFCTSFANTVASDVVVQLLHVCPSAGISSVFVPLHSVHV